MDDVIILPHLRFRPVIRFNKVAKFHDPRGLEKMLKSAENDGCVFLRTNSKIH